MCPRYSAVAAVFAALLASALAQDTLVPGPGADLTQAKCAICHEIGHVTRIRQTRPEWEETMRVMVTRGAPLTPQEIRTITDYLATYYGREAPPAAAAARAGPAASTEPVMKLLNQHACLGCHAIDRQVVGPAFRDIAGKYRGNAAAGAQLARKLKAGGQGVWGQVPMPPNPSLTDGDAKLIVDWVLSQK